MSNLLTSRPLTSRAEYNRYVAFPVQYRHGDADCRTEKLYAQIGYTPAHPHNSTIRLCRQLSRSLDICRHPQSITFGGPEKHHGCTPLAAMISEEPWAMRSPKSLDDLQMCLIECCGSIIVGTPGLGTLSLWTLSTASTS